MSNLEETKEFLKKHCLQKCNHNTNESCICKVAICFKEIEKVQEMEKEMIDTNKEEIEDYKNAKALMKCYNCQDNINGNCLIFNAKANLSTYIICLKYDLQNYEDYLKK